MNATTFSIWLLFMKPQDVTWSPETASGSLSAVAVGRAEINLVQPLSLFDMIL